ncbi:MAG: right-handed parallel beta-helix repeat-containing protein [Acidobacteriota bacterium]|nr:right-handed parallel beta-helix repeat-containing protein [Acidobacteriota bacterium]
MACRKAAVGFCLLTFTLCLAAPAGAQQVPTIEPRPGLVIAESVNIKPGVYRLPVSGDAPLITVRGANIVIDFQGAVLEGTDPASDPDGYAGTALLVDGGERVTIRNAIIRGYKVAVHARKSPGLQLSRNDFSHNWKQRLWSLVEHESLLDWMSYHSNEKDEWLRFGGAIYLVECDDARIDHNTVRQGQNGLMVTKSSGLSIWNNDFSFNSSLGIGLYRVSDSRLLHNRIDWNVRGYSDGFYNRGQDSAGLLMYEQSSNNIVAYNSVTHSGDGLFLWAGQSTMDTGQGGANDNLFYRNDFSHAPTNGIETTFSRNYFIENRIEENWHGVWGGYSWSSVFDGNRFSRNDEAIAIEHGQDNRIRNNVFDGDGKAIRLWANDSQDPNWGYPKNRDTRSRNFDISYNRFSGNDVALEVDDTVDLALRGNSFDKVASRLITTGATDRLAFSIPGVSVLRDPSPLLPIPAPLDEGIDAMIPDGARRGREHIIVDEWGPYDFLSPKIWLAPPAAGVTSRDQSANSGQVSSKPVPINWISEERRFPLGGQGAYRGEAHGPLALRVLGPEGAWNVARVTGGTLSTQSGRVPGDVTFTPQAGAAEWRVDLEYTGAAIVTPRGRRIAAGQPSTFSFARFDPAIEWHARWYAWPESADPIAAPAAFRQVLDGAPLVEERVRRLDFINGRALREGLPADRVALVAEGRLTLPSGPDGAYELVAISDDGVRVWVDGNLVVDRWNVHESVVDRAPIAGGAHTLRVEYFEATGWAELRLDFVRIN